MTSSVYQLPPDLPIPVDDGGCDHLPGRPLPGIALASTRGRAMRLDEIAAQPVVFFVYPRTGQFGVPAGSEWDAIPGARGCTPQACGYRDLYREFLAQGIQVFGISTQTTMYQREFVERNHVPFELLSDADLALAGALRLPTFEYPVVSGDGSTLLKRMAWYADRGRIEKVWYPVFPPDRNAETVLEWLRARARLLGAGRDVELA
jgi:peroxiredoxin